MSVKFDQRETIRAVLPDSKDDLAHKVGNALTRGSGPRGYLEVSTRVPTRPQG